MEEVVLVLSHQEKFLNIVRERLEEGSVRKVLATHGQVSIKFHHVTTLIVDKMFYDDARVTATYVANIRSILNCPIIGFEMHEDGGDLTDLQAAGCSFLVRPAKGFDQVDELLAEDVCDGPREKLQLIRAERTAKRS